MSNTQRNITFSNLETKPKIPTIRNILSERNDIIFTRPGKSSSWSSEKKDSGYKDVKKQKSHINIRMTYLQKNLMFRDFSVCIYDGTSMST